MLHVATLEGIIPWYKSSMIKYRVPNNGILFIIGMMYIHVVLCIIPSNLVLTISVFLFWAKLKYCILIPVFTVSF